MSIFDNIKKSVSEIRETIESEVEEKGYTELVQDISSVVGQGYNSRMKASQYLRAAVGWVYACVGVISDEIAGIELKLMTIKNGEKTEVEDHPVMDLIYKANNASTKFDLIKLTFQYLEQTGEAPWFLSFKNGIPQSILLLRPDRLTIKPGKDGELIGGYTYKIYGNGGAQEINLEPYEVMLLKYPDPDQTLRGKGPLQAAATTYDLDNYSERWNTKFFKNSATPEAVLATDKVLSKETRERLERKMAQKYQGVENSHKTVILEGGLKMEKLTISQKDMDFIEQQRFSRDKILAIFRVPRTALGITDDVNRANAEATDYVFAKRTIKPKMIGFVEQLNSYLLPLFKGTENMVFDFEDPVPQNVDQNIAKATAGINGGYLTINEARALNGFDPIDGGDELREPVSFNPIQQDPNQNSITSPRKTIKPSRSNKHFLNSKNRVKNDNDKQTKVIQTMVQESLIPIIYDNLKKKYDLGFSKQKAIREKLFSGSVEESKNEKYLFQEKQLNMADSYVPKVVSKLNSVFQSQKEIILDGLDRGVKIKLNEDTELLRYEEKLKPVMIELMRSQSKLAFQLLGQEKSVIESKANGQTFLQTLSTYFTNRIYKIAPDITHETNQKLQAEFAEAAKKEESIPQIKTRVRNLFENMENYRAERIARTETIRGSNFSTEESYKASGVVEAKEWLTTKDERTDDECMQLDGKVIPLDTNFANKGDTLGGIKLDYENVTFPPLHVNCRCTLIPVIGTPLKEGQWKASMNKDQAEAFVKDSKIKTTLYHGTTDKAKDNIEINGFNITTHDIGEGVYVTGDKKIAADYAKDAAQLHKSNAAVVPLKVNIKNLKTFTNTSDFVDAVEAEYGNITNASATAYIKKFDAVKIKDIDYIIIPDPKSVVAIKNFKI